jgi:hypothetical protein
MGISPLLQSVLFNVFALSEQNDRFHRAVITFDVAVAARWRV